MNPPNHQLINGQFGVAVGKIFQEAYEISAIAGTDARRIRAKKEKNND